MTPSHESRRSFLKRSATGVVGLLSFPMILPATVFGARAPSHRITLGFIGVGSHGVDMNLRMFLPQEDAEVLAVCDVYEDRRKAAKVLVDQHYGNQDCAVYGDFRELLERSDIDAVVISTPDHWHVPISLMAIRAGKDVCCEKPTFTIAEGRLLSDMVRRHGAVFQMATEDRSVWVYHRMAELVRYGRIGKLECIRVTLPSGTRYPNEDPETVPQGLDYDLWLGPAPWAPYTAHRCDAQHWRRISDYSGGQFADWGAHLIDTAQWANDTERTGPISVEGRGVFDESSMYDTALDYELQYTYSNGVNMAVKSGGVGLRFEGSEGWVGNDQWRGPIQASSQGILDCVIGPDESRLFTCPQGEQRNFLDCVKSRLDPYFPAEIGHRCSSVMHMGNIAMLLGRKLTWDPDAEEFVGDETANRMRSRPMRETWRLT